MVTLEQLRHFLAVVEWGTLTAAADELHVTQPALSRSMQRLERAFPLPLFERSANTLMVTDVGQTVAKHARSVLDQVQAMTDEVAAIERRQRTIDVVSCAPIPLWRLLPRIEQALPGMTIASRLTGVAEVEQALASGEAQLGITITPPARSEAGFRCGAEHLQLSVPPAHPAATRKELWLRELDGETMLLHSQIGFWADLVRERMPRANFLVQDPQALATLVRQSSLPVFITDIVGGEAADDHRVRVPIRDAEANPTYWCHLGRGHNPALETLAASIGRRGLW
ncbi:MULTISPECIES: LysR family transcriptional regulator [unclassified Luteococcus]|uniref:LysR family transcriptional regulator n=1 Tax=unclassified Luteococcus TaxID=2639923 RepID=UPI00313DCE8B